VLKIAGIIVIFALEYMVLVKFMKFTFFPNSKYFYLINFAFVDNHKLFIHYNDLSE
jgi:hypothetical protein